MNNELLRVIYPRRCPGCRTVIAPDMLVCEECRKKFKRIQSPYCMKCGRHIADETEEFCDDCKSKKHHYTAGIAVLEYDETAQNAMSDLKFNGYSENAEFFAAEAVEWCSERIRALKPDVLIPVPVHRSKRLYRGYNQAELIAEGIGKALNIPVVNDLLIRSRKTRAQKLLGSESRSGNLAHAFSCDNAKYSSETVAMNFKRVMLIDDIYTTGATMENCTMALLEGGVGEVVILSITMGRNY